MAEERPNHLPDFLQSVKLKHVKLGYHYLLSNLVTILVIPAAFFALLEGIRTDPEDLLLVWRALERNAVGAAIFFTISLLGFAFLFFKRPRPVYLVDFSCHRPADCLRTSYHKFVEHIALSGGFEDSALRFQEKIIERSGLGDETYIPDSIHKIPPETSLALARAEAEEVMFGAMDSLLRKTKVNPRDIGILVVNSSLFNPTPSLSSMIVNKYKLRGNILSFSLGGMGCSAGVIALDLAKDLLQVHRNTYAIVISTENITQNRYFGKSKSMLIPNCLFRVGGAAILLTNRSTERRRSKYKLRHVVRTHCGADDKAFKCVFQEQDEEGNTGVSLSKDLMAIAGGALKANITTLGPLVLPISEQLLFFLTLVARKLLKGQKIKPYIPDFKVAFDHFCIHAGGRAVIDEMEKNLRLLPSDVEASRMMLHRFGNTSSSSIWYELAYIEAKGRMKKGHRVWQIAFGSGFKCNSAVWVALRNVSLEEDSPWRDCIDRYPVELLPDKTTYLPPRKKT